MDRCVYGSIAQRGFHKRLSTEGNVFLVKDRKEQTEANCAMIHHRHNYDISQCNLIQRYSKPFLRPASPERAHPAYHFRVDVSDTGENICMPESATEINRN